MVGIIQAYGIDQLFSLSSLHVKSRRTGNGPLIVLGPNLFLISGVVTGLVLNLGLKVSGNQRTGRL
jgi:hypothetical protein